MKLKNFKGDEVTIVVSTDELAFFHSAIRETLEAVPKGEFRVRTGETPAQALRMWRELDGFLDKIEG
jgi:hypothetical protein